MPDWFFAVAWLKSLWPLAGLAVKFSFELGFGILLSPDVAGCRLPRKLEVGFRIVCLGFLCVVPAWDIFQKYIREFEHECPQCVFLEF